jgi:lipopolysaccharide/colanic/teichoic acid biosynthesis glycosyltransferase
MSTLSRTTSSTADVNGQRYYALSKRLVDVVLSAVSLIALSPLFALIAFLIKMDSPGPILFVQTRIGKNGRPFRIWKFRTMQHGLDDSCHRAFMRAFVRGEIACTENESSEPATDDGQSHSSTKDLDEGEDLVFKPFEESQVTRVGRILRRTSIDELPQLVNVLMGDMSLVGSRPNVPWEVKEYQDWHRERLVVLPGITGLAQVNGRSAIDFDTIARYDIEYVQKQNLWLDLRILAETVLQVLNRRGAE